MDSKVTVKAAPWGHWCSRPSRKERFLKRLEKHTLTHTNIHEAGWRITKDNKERISGGRENTGKSHCERGSHRSEGRRG